MAYEIDLSGKVALVTGASSGLGERFARVLAQAGATVARAARRVERLKELRAEIDAEGGEAHVYGLDVTDVASVRACVAAVENDLKKIDILVNNSGVSATSRIVDTSEDDFDFVMNTNAKGAYFVAQQVGKVMIAKKTPGRIINIASLAGMKVLSKLSVYSMSKAAVIHMTRAMALEWGRYGITGGYSFNKCSFYIIFWQSFALVQFHHGMPMAFQQITFTNSKITAAANATWEVLQIVKTFF